MRKAEVSPTQRIEAEGRVERKGFARYRESVVVFLLRLAVTAALLLGWELASGRFIDVLWISSPSRIAFHFVKIVSSGQLANDLRVTLYETLVGFVAGAVGGIGIGLALGRLEKLARVLNPFIIALNGIPRIALAPLIIVWFGIGMLSKIVLSGVVAFFMVFFNTFTGMRSVDPELKRMVRVMGAEERDVMRKIVLPAASPWIIAGLKMAVPYALIGAIIGEFIASSRGLGFRVQFDSAIFNTTGTMTGIMVIAVMVMAGGEILDRLEKRVLRWRPPEHLEEVAEIY